MPKFPEIPEFPGILPEIPGISEKKPGSKRIRLPAPPVSGLKKTDLFGFPDFFRYLFSFSAVFQEFTEKKKRVDCKIPMPVTRHPRTSD